MPDTLTKRYWRAALFVPALGALAGYGIGQAAFLLATGFVMIAIPYLPFAALMWWLIGRISSVTKVVVLAYSAPIIFLPFVFVFVAVLALFRVWDMTWSTVLDDLPGLAALVLIFAYAYVVLLSIVFAVLKVVASRKAANDSRGLMA